MRLWLLRMKLYLFRPNYFHKVFFSNGPSTATTQGIVPAAELGTSCKSDLRDEPRLMHPELVAKPYTTLYLVLEHQFMSHSGMFRNPLVVPRKPEHHIYKAFGIHSENCDPHPLFQPIIFMTATATRKKSTMHSQRQQDFFRRMDHVLATRYVREYLGHERERRSQISPHDTQTPQFWQPR